MKSKIVISIQNNLNHECCLNSVFSHVIVARITVINTNLILTQTLSGLHRVLLHNIGIFILQLGSHIRSSKIEPLRMDRQPSGIMFSIIKKR